MVCPPLQFIACLVDVLYDFKQRVQSATTPASTGCKAQQDTYTLQFDHCNDNDNYNDQTAVCMRTPSMMV